MGVDTWTEEEPEEPPEAVPAVVGGFETAAEADLQAFEQKTAEWPLVRECFMLNGEIDFVLKIVAHDLQEFQMFLTSELTPAPNVASVKTSLTIRTSKKEPGVPIPPVR